MKLNMCWNLIGKMKLGGLDSTLAKAFPGLPIAHGKWVKSVPGCRGLAEEESTGVTQLRS